MGIQLSPDTPLLSARQDRLGLAAFASKVVRAILVSSREHSFVLGINGKWGMGKSTVLNFIVEELERAAEAAPIFVSFNPWRFSGAEDLARSYFSELIGAIPLDSRHGRRLRDAVAAYADRVSGPAVLAPESSGWLSRLWRPRSPSLQSLQDKVVGLLASLDRRIVVMVDDIDRLPEAEIRQLFRVIKAVANLPSITYILAFDRDVVSEALREGEGRFGEAYLDKIVQLPLDLPRPERGALRRFLGDKLDALFDDVPDEEFDRAYWATVFYEGIDPLISSPRDVTRLDNVLQALYPTIRDEVNPVDFVAIQTLRIFAPATYAAIRDHGLTLLGRVGRTVEADQRYRTALANLVLSGETERDRAAIRSLVTIVFPQIGRLLGQQTMEGDQETDWRRRRRACSPDVFPAYFRFELPEGSVSFREMTALLRAAPSREEVRRQLAALAESSGAEGGSRARLALERLEDHLGDVEPGDLARLVLGILDAADEIVRREPEPAGLHQPDVRVEIKLVVHRLLRRLPAADRSAAFSEAIESSPSVYTLASALVLFEQEHGRYGGRPTAEGEEAVLAPEELAGLEARLAARIRGLAASGMLVGVPSLGYVLALWRDWDNAGYSAWLPGAFAADEILVALLESLMITGRSATTGSRVRVVRLEDVVTFVDPAHARERAARLVQEERWSGRQRLALEAFLREF